MRSLYLFALFALGSFAGVGVLTVAGVLVP
jgi:hypothetical protein